LKKSDLKRLSIIVGFCFILVGVTTQSSFAQAVERSTFQIGKQKAQKGHALGEGSLIGTTMMLGKKVKIPLAFIEVDGGKSIQADLKGRFKLVLNQGTYKIKIECTGYKDLVIESIAIKEGTDLYIKIELANSNRGKFN